MIKQMTSEELKNLILHGNKEIIKRSFRKYSPQISLIFCMKMKIHQKKS